MGDRGRGGGQPKNVAPRILRQSGQSRDRLFICNTYKDIEVFPMLGQGAATAEDPALRLVNLNKSNYK
jgi:hypothetical protein